MRETVFVKLRVSDYFSKTTVYSSAGEYLSYFILRQVLYSYLKKFVPTHLVFTKLSHLW